MNKFGRLAIFTLTMVVLIASLGLTSAVAARVEPPLYFCSNDVISPTERWAGATAVISFRSGPEAVTSAWISLTNDESGFSYLMPVDNIARDEATKNGWTGFVFFPNDPGTYRTYLTIYSENFQCGRSWGASILK